MLVIDSPPVAERDLSGGDAIGLLNELAAAGAIMVTESVDVVALLCSLKPAGKSCPGDS